MPGTGSLIGKKYFGGRGNANVGHWYDFDPYSTNETGFSTRGNYSRRKAFEEAVKEDLNKLKDPNSNYGNMVFGRNSTQRQDYINKYERFLNSVSTLGEGDENERQWYNAASSTTKIQAGIELSKLYPLTLDAAGANRAMGTLSIYATGIGATSAL